MQIYKISVYSMHGYLLIVLKVFLIFCLCILKLISEVYGQLVLLQTRTESTRTFSLVNSYFFATRTLVNSYFFFGQLVLFFGQLVLFLWSTRTF